MVPIDVIAGFLGAGKTSLMGELIRNEALQNQNIIILQCEEGEEELSGHLPSNVQVLNIDGESELSTSYFMELEKKYEPDHILIEYNGTWKLQSFLQTKLPKGYCIGKIISMIAGNTFHSYIQNMPAMIVDSIVESDYVLLTQHEGETKQLQQEIKKAILKLNKAVVYHVLPTKHNDEQQAIMNQLAVTLDNYQNDRVYHMMKSILGLLGIAIILLYLRMLQVTNDQLALAHLQQIYSVFTGLILEIMPFVLIGTFIASLLQVLVSEERLKTIFMKHRLLGFPLAIVLGIIFPVCDCTLIPISAKMMKKGVSVVHTMLFMTCAMVVNPLVLLSTYYAFSNQPQMVLYRLGMGLLMAVSVSIILGIYFSNKKSTAWQQTVWDKGVIPACSSGYMGELNYQGTLGKVEAIMRHTTLEFMYILPLAMIGALVATYIQVNGTFQNLGMMSNPLMMYGLLIAISMTMSICGTSNAFMAKGFTKILPTSFLNSFMVMGPMLDFKNLLMMTTYFSKRFITIYISSLLIVGFILTMLFGIWI